MSTELLTLSVVTAVFSAGAAWGGVKTGLNGMRSEIRKLVKDTESMKHELGAVHDKLHALDVRVTVIERGGKP